MSETKKRKKGISHNECIRILENAFQTILDSGMGCWYVAGYQSESYITVYDDNHVLEIWPNRDSEGYFQPACFDFCYVIKDFDLEGFVFDQEKGFELSWTERGSKVRLVINVYPKEEDSE